MNNNRGNNNRRRGRGNNRQQGGQYSNRIDSRARGNAPQLLDKYKKLAHDAHLNGDRVTEETYLQFADHYFRVIADQKQRQEDSRQQRSPERNQDDDESDGDSGAGRDSDRDFPQRSNQSDDRNGNADRGSRRHSNEQDEASDDASENDADEQFEPPANPFTRPKRPVRAAAKPRQPRRASRDDDDDRGGGHSEDPVGLDPSTLPPSISNDGDGEEKTQAKPRRRAPVRRAKPAADEGGEELESLS